MAAAGQQLDLASALFVAFVRYEYVCCGTFKHGSSVPDAVARSVVAVAGYPDIYSTDESVRHEAGYDRRLLCLIRAAGNDDSTFSSVVSLPHGWMDFSPWRA